jgi:hypothetical protein
MLFRFPTRNEHHMLWCVPVQGGHGSSWQRSPTDSWSKSPDPLDHSLPTNRPRWSVYPIYPTQHGSLNVPIEHHPTIRYIIYNGYYKGMSNIPKMGQLPPPDEVFGWLLRCGFWSEFSSSVSWLQSSTVFVDSAGYPMLAMEGYGTPKATVNFVTCCPSWVWWWFFSYGLTTDLFNLFSSVSFPSFPSFLFLLLLIPFPFFLFLFLRNSFPFSFFLFLPYCVNCYLLLSFDPSLPLVIPL